MKIVLYIIRIIISLVWLGFGIGIVCLLGFSCFVLIDSIAPWIPYHSQITKQDILPLTLITGFFASTFLACFTLFFIPAGCCISQRLFFLIKTIGRKTLWIIIGLSLITPIIFLIYLVWLLNLACKHHACSLN